MFDLRQGNVRTQETWISGEGKNYKYKEGTKV